MKEGIEDSTQARSAKSSVVNHEATPNEKGKGGYVEKDKEGDTTKKVKKM